MNKALVGSSLTAGLEGFVDRCAVNGLLVFQSHLFLHHAQEEARYLK